MKSILSNFSVSIRSFTFVIALYFAFIINIPIYKELANIFSNLNSVKFGFILSIPFFFVAAFNFIFNIFSFPIFTKPFYFLLLIVSSIVCYAAFNYGTIFNQDMIINILETDQAESSSYFSLYSISWVVLMGIIPAILIMFIPFKKVNTAQEWVRFFIDKILSMLGSIIVILIIAALYYQDYSSIGRNNSHLRQLIIPTYYVNSLYKVIKNKYFATPEPYIELGLDAKQSNHALDKASTRPTLLVFVLGETARSQNYQLNGYEKPTNPYTKKHNVISFLDVSSCGTATAISVPCMFSKMTRNEFNLTKARNQNNVLDIIKRSGVDILWKENDGGDKEVAKNLKKIEIDRKQINQFCDGSSCQDHSLLENLTQDIDNLKGNRIIVLHLMGSHGPTYYKRYPKDKAFFKPDCPRADIENCSVEEIVNTYDNTILYTDLVISDTIDVLKSLEKKYDSALFYISDHGESLGEYGLFLHGMPYGLAPETQTKVPLLFWMSPSFEKDKNISASCLREQAKIKDKFSQDYVFHSLLGIMDVQTSVYDNNLDIFFQCRK